MKHVDAMPLGDARFIWRALLVLGFLVGWCRVVGQLTANGRSIPYSLRCAPQNSSRLVAARALAGFDDAPSLPFGSSYLEPRGLGRSADGPSPLHGYGAHPVRQASLHAVLRDRGNESTHAHDGEVRYLLCWGMGIGWLALARP